MWDSEAGWLVTMLVMMILYFVFLIGLVFGIGYVILYLLKIFGVI